MIPITWLPYFPRAIISPQKGGRIIEKKAFTAFSLREQPQLLKVTAQWFHSKWQIPCWAYEDNMQECSTGTAFIPQWCVILDSSGIIITGAELTANDLHEHKESAPNVYALCMENTWRGNRYARMLLGHIRRETDSEELSRPYPITDRTVFHEICGWGYLSLIREDNGDSIRMHTTRTL